MNSFGIRDFLKLLIILITGYLVYQLSSSKEGFGSLGKEFIPLGYPRYDLKGDLLSSHPVNIPEPPDYHCCDKCSYHLD